MKRGSVASALRSGDSGAGAKKEPLPWADRVRIAAEAAQALAFLATGAAIPLVHGGLTLDNILLASDGSARVRHLGCINLSRSMAIFLNYLFGVGAGGGGGGRGGGNIWLAHPPPPRSYRIQLMYDESMKHTSHAKPRYFC